MCISICMHCICMSDLLKYLLILLIHSPFPHFTNFQIFGHLDEKVIHLILQTPLILLGNVPQPKRPGIKPKLKNSLAAFLFHHLPPPLPPPLHHFHPRSAFVDSCPKWVCACACVCVLFYCNIFPFFNSLLTFFAFKCRAVFIVFALYSFSQLGSGSCPGRGGDLPLCYSLLAHGRETDK